ncbi:unnamed protein product [Cuscuta epithymum]|uniref:Integrase catalytic domain-containing protein n=1 Tax=Cuscuta epithymum TaxID=186058 RepID=A0AAV0DI24_9ASTE|nr:unnamed protein product [Cuscuta epithymum]
MGERRNGLYYLREITTAQVLTISGSNEFDIWHKRMGHPSVRVMNKLAPMRDFNKSLSSSCDVCFRAKQSKESFPDSTNKTSNIFELVHCDLWGPYNTASSCGAKLFLTIVDEFSRAVWIYLLMDKREVFTMFMSFIAMVERQFSKKVFIIRSDNGTEFNCLKEFFWTSGIIFQTSCVATPQQNGCVERKHQHILNVARALQFQAHLLIKFWGECILMAAHLINRTPASVLQFRTPYELLFGSPPSYTSLRIFGCLCYAYNLKSKGDKFTSRSRKCIFVGYVFGKKGWNLYDLDTCEFFVSRDVKFSEDIFPFADDSLDAPELIPENGEDLLVASYDDQYVTNSAPAPVTPVDISTPESPHPVASVLDPPPDPLVEVVGRGHRVKHPYVRLKDYVTHTVQKYSSIPSSATPAASSGTPFPISHYVSCDNFSSSHRAFLAAISSRSEPQTFKEAVADPGWRAAMRDEI